LTGVIISPHCDDAALCLGGALASGALGPVHVVNIFTRSDSRQYSRLRRLRRAVADVEAITEIRLREDQHALIDHVQGLINLGFPDTGVRGGGQEDNPEGDNLAADRALAAEVADALAAALADLDAECLFFPCGIGLHRDHVIAAGIGRDHARSRGSVLFYADRPYICRLSEADAAAALADFAVAEQIPLDGGELQRKRTMLQRYRSQLDRKRISQVIDYDARNGGETLYVLK
jgi:LmbE family N-acetylglucosaminyl deacetylase